MAEMTKEESALLFARADYFAWDDPEELQHECVEDALMDFFDSHAYGKNIREVIAEHAPVEIFSYHRKSIGECDFRSTAESLVEQTIEWFADEFGGLDGDMPGVDKDFERDLANEFASSLERMFARHEVHAWQCERSLSRKFSAAECETLMREHCPSWFEEPGESDVFVRLDRLHSFLRSRNVSYTRGNWNAATARYEDGRLVIEGWTFYLSDAFEQNEWANLCDETRLKFNACTFRGSEREGAAP